MKYATKINEYFYNPKQLLLIPLYQRAYAWEEVHCKRLFDDIIKVHKNQLQSHFFGSIVSVQDNQLEDDLLIIDGQQRITTVSIIVLALKNAVKNGEITCSMSDDDLEESTKSYLYAKLRKVDRKIKLRPIERDLKAYDALFANNPNEFVKGAGVTRNYDFFYSQIANCGLSFDDIFNALEKFIIIDLRLESSDNPQLIFESLNSTGKDLTEADKVRNYLLMSLSKQQQDEYYSKYWRNIEIFTDEDPTMFIRDFLTINLKRICNIDNLYFEFKEYDELYHLKRENLFKELLHFAKFYNQISKGNIGNDVIDKKLKQLASIGSFVAMPFYLSYFDFAEQHNIPIEKRYEVLDITENFWARRIICSYPANALNKLYSTLHSDIIKVFATHEKRGIALGNSMYPEVMKHILLRKQGNAKFPTDLEISESFMTRWIYKLPINYRYFLFERMENGNNKDAIMPIVEGMKKGQITIEHIMPQTLTTQWKQDLGDNYAEIHSRYLHTFANLTLTAYNSSYSNHPFAEKRDGYTDKKGGKVYGFKDSNYSLSSFLKNCTSWTENEILQREKILLDRFLSLWPMIATSYEPLEKDADIVSFADDEYEFTGRKLMAFSYKGQKYDVSTWKDMLVMVCKLIYAENKNTVLYLCSKNDTFHSTSNFDRTCFAEGCYVYTSCSTKSKQSILSYLFKNCGISDSELELYLQPQSEKIEEESDDLFSSFV